MRPAALDEPTTPVGGRWIATWTAALFGMYAAYYGAAQVLLPKQAEEIVGNDDKVALVSWVTGIAALVTVVITVAAGVRSDRTRAAGRHRWVLGGALLTGAAMLAQGFAGSGGAMIAGWALANAGIACMTAALFAVVPDEVPVTQRAGVSAWFGIAISVGPLLGIALVTLVVLGVRPGFALLGVLAMALALPYAFPALRRRGGVPVAVTPRRSGGLAGVFAPLRHADFAWAWTGRFLIQLSNALAQVYLFFYLKDFLHHPDPDTGTFVLALVYTVGVVAAALPAGRISDRTQRRKRMVVISSLLQGGAGLVFAFVPVFEMTIVGAALLGIGYGVYASVDQALVTEVLPDPGDRGRDLGVINIANVAPYALTGLVGGVVISSFGYPTLMLLVVLTGALAALTVQPIKSVR